MPSTISCDKRISRPCTYSMLVIGRSAASFSPMSESSSSSGTRPTCATHTLTLTSRSPIAR
jgi:hypothetical protein